MLKIVFQFRGVAAGDMEVIRELNASDAGKCPGVLPTDHPPHLSNYRRIGPARRVRSGSNQGCSNRHLVPDWVRRLLSQLLGLATGGGSTGADFEEAILLGFYHPSYPARRSGVRYN